MINKESLDDPSHDNLLKEVGIRLNIARKLRRFTQNKIGEISTVDRTTQWKIENGVHNMTVQTAFSLIRCYDLNPVIFFIDEYDFKILYKELKNILPIISFGDNSCVDLINLRKNPNKQYFSRLNEIVNDTFKSNKDEIHRYQLIDKKEVKFIKYEVINEKASKISAAIGLHIQPDKEGFRLGMYLGNILYSPS